ncbi:MAG: DEAD/DEAH box helicase [Candidatus Kapabacteria bacterium]|nr:DEAD/DEAH box helicase [Ignavibacteriota bacterium]MCW5886345.1 DEAD/DEAH box helicase [Candidatus Kapabacteria bacterium]
MELRDYQLKLAKKGNEILQLFGIVYYAIEMRVGKTLIALKTAELAGAQNVLLVSKKKALASICNDYEKFGFNFYINIINYEQLKNHSKASSDVIICDEAHGLGAYPKPSERTKILKDILKNNPGAKLILMSGTPSPESYSQLYHQFAISANSPFEQSNFYQFAKEFVNVKEVTRGGLRFRDYKDCNKDKVMQVLEKYFVRFTQSDAGFSQNEVLEKIIKIPVSDNVKKMVKILKKEKYYQFKDGSEVICDSAVKLQTKIHQVYSGTVKTEDDKYKVIDISKAEWIKNYYKGQKIAIFYKFIAEGEVLKKLMPNSTDSPEKFNQEPETVFICQIQSGSMGVNLASADILIFYNIDFSALQYWQARARLQDFKRDKPPLVHWLMIENGIEEKVYQAVLNKKDYTLHYFKKDFINAS